MSASNHYDLVVDTSRKGIVLGLYSQPGTKTSVCVERFEPTARGELLGAMLDEILGAAHATLSQVQRVLVTLGPGTFTGLRTGIAFCEGLCITGTRTLHGVSTLRALATLVPAGIVSLAWPPGVVVIYKARPGYWYIGCAEGEFFDDTACALKHLQAAQMCIVDEAAWNEAAFAELPRASWLLDNGSAIRSFGCLLAWQSAQRVQKANYIQDSYFEKKA